MNFCSMIRAAVASTALSIAALSSAGAAEIIVPHYAAPGFTNTVDWQRIIDAAHSNYQITTVFNPANGPGTSQNADFLRATTEYRACGACSDLLGFVATRLSLTTLRPIADVKSEIDRYYQWYPVTGIFLDELPSEAEMFTVAPNGTVGPSANRDQFLGYYSELYTYIKGKSNQFDRVIANPGTRTDEAFLIGGTGTNGVQYGQAADALTVFENTYGVLKNGYTPTPWNTSRDYSDQLGYLVHTTTGVNLFDAIDTVRANGADILYITDGCEPSNTSCSATFDNRYNQLPTYWDSLLSRAGEVCVVPEPGSLALVMAGLAAVGFSRRRKSSLTA
jgi:Spherulation-specific family 4/PEP-CTERM motif